MDTPRKQASKLQTEDLPQISTIGMLILNILLFVPSPTGVVYMDDGRYLIETKIFARTAGFMSHGAERLHKALRSLLAANMISALEYRTSKIALVTLRPLIDNFNEYRVFPDMQDNHERIVAMMQRTRQNNANIQNMLSEAATKYFCTCRTGFDHPDNFNHAHSILKKFHFYRNMDKVLRDDMYPEGELWGDNTPYHMRSERDQKFGRPRERCVEGKRLAKKELEYEVMCAKQRIAERKAEQIAERIKRAEALRKEIDDENTTQEA